MAKKKKKSKKKQGVSKKLIMITLLVLVVAFAIDFIVYSNKTDEAEVLKKYFSLLSNKEYEQMYDLVETSFSKEEFVTRVKNIYEGIEAENISILVTSNSKDTNKKDETTITYTNMMNTYAGFSTFANKTTIKKVGDTNKIIWNSSMIFPDLDDDEKIRVETVKSSRGSILDRNGIAIAKQGMVYQVGLVQGKMDDSTDLNKLANLLDINREDIDNALSKEYVKEGTFVPLKKISKQEQDLKNELLQIKGVMISDTESRVYPYNEATSIMTGYVQDGEGKSGLEYAYNDKLKGKDGIKIYIEKDGVVGKTVVEKKVQNGEDIKITIDINIQNKVYEQFKEDKSATVVMNYKTGEILALVSTPSYNANDFSIGISEEKWNEIQNNEAKPMYNRYLSSYVPGSSFKPIMGAIGLANESFTAEEDFGESGLKWQPDSSWNNLFITTLEQYSEPANLQNALVYSDNIYFAKAALKVGAEKIKSSLDQLGFNKKIDFPQDVTPSTYGEMTSDAEIANTGFGQGNTLVNPIHMASIYSCFANNGEMIKPKIENNTIASFTQKEKEQEVISSQIAQTIKEDLRKVVTDGTAKDCNIEEKTIYGKTGTAEIKENQNDNNGTEIGWFNSFDNNETLIISMVENVKNKGRKPLCSKKGRRNI